tara:strand:+ start:835 stop:1041 length:207 start_codon:yes stop_codon:yes gene_type:complete
MSGTIYINKEEQNIVYWTLIEKVKKECNINRLSQLTIGQALAYKKELEMIKRFSIPVYNNLINNVHEF